MEERNISYPIKYALLAMIEPSSWELGLNELELEYEICGYIVSKVYLMGINTKILCDGSSRICYEVVYPYKSDKDLEMRNIPKFNLDGECYNYDKVLNVYDTFEEAKEVSEQCNHVLRRKYISNISLTDCDWKLKLINKQKDFDSRLDNYKIFEKSILERTQDMGNVEVNCTLQRKLKI